METVKSLKELIDLLVKVLKDLQSKKGFQRFGKATKKDFEEAIKLLEAYRRGTLKLNNEMISALTRATQAMARISKSSYFKAISKQGQESVKVFQALADEMLKYGRVTDKSLKNISKNVNSFIIQIHKSQSFLGRTLTYFVRQIQWYGSKAFSTRLLAIPSEVLKSYADYAQSLTNIASVARLLPYQMKQVSDEIMKISMTTKFSATELGDVSQKLAQAGMSFEEIVKSLRPLANLATATASDIRNAADLVISVTRAFNVPTEQLIKVTDILTGAITQSKLRLDDLRTSLGYVGSAASQAKLTIEDTVTALGILANRGLRSTTAATGLRMALLKLIAPTEKAKKVLHEAGLTIDQVNPRFHSFSEVLRKLSTLTPRQLVQIFSARSANAILALLDTGVDTFERLKKQIEATGHSSVMAMEQLLSLQQTFKNFRDIITNTYIGVGSTFGRELGITIRTVSNEIRENSKAFTEITGDVIKFTAVIGGGTGLIYLVKKATDALSFLQITLGRISATIKTMSFTKFVTRFSILAGLATLVADQIYKQWTAQERLNTAVKESFIMYKKYEDQQKVLTIQMDELNKRYEKAPEYLKKDIEMLKKLYKERQKLIEQKFIEDFNKTEGKKYGLEITNVNKQVSDTLDTIVRVKEQLPKTAQEVIRFGEEWKKSGLSIEDFLKKLKPEQLKHLSDILDDLNKHATDYSGQFKGSLLFLKLLIDNIAPGIEELDTRLKKVIKTQEEFIKLKDSIIKESVKAGGITFVSDTAGERIKTLKTTLENLKNATDKTSVELRNKINDFLKNYNNAIILTSDNVEKYLPIIIKNWDLFKKVIGDIDPFKIQIKKNLKVFNEMFVGMSSIIKTNLKNVARTFTDGQIELTNRYKNMVNVLNNLGKYNKDAIEKFFGMSIETINELKNKLGSQHLAELLLVKPSKQELQAIKDYGFWIHKLSDSYKETFLKIYEVNKGMKDNVKLLLATGKYEQAISLMKKYKEELNDIVTILQKSGKFELASKIQKQIDYIDNVIDEALRTNIMKKIHDNYEKWMVKINNLFDEENFGSIGSVIDNIVTNLKKYEQELMNSGKYTENDIKKIEEMIQKLKEYKSVAEDMKEVQKAYQKVVKEQEQWFYNIDKLFKVEKYDRAIQKIKDDLHEVEQAIKVFNEKGTMTEKEQQELQKLQETQKKLSQMLEQAKIYKQVKDENEKIRKEHEKLMKDIENIWKDGWNKISDIIYNWIRQWDISLKDIEKMFKDMVARLVATWVTGQIKITLSGILGGVKGGSLNLGKGQQGLDINTISTLKSLTSFTNFGSSKLWQWLGAKTNLAGAVYLPSGFNEMGYAYAGEFTTQTSPAMFTTSTWTKLGNAFGAGAVGALIGGLYGQIFGKNTTSTSILGGLGGIAGSFLPIPGGTFIGGLVGSVLGGVFGGHKRKPKLAMSIEDYVKYVPGQGFVGLDEFTYKPGSANNWWVKRRLKVDKEFGDKIKEAVQQILDSYGQVIDSLLENLPDEMQRKYQQKFQSLDIHLHTLSDKTGKHAADALKKFLEDISLQVYNQISPELQNILKDLSSTLLSKEEGLGKYLTEDVKKNIKDVLNELSNIDLTATTKEELQSKVKELQTTLGEFGNVGGYLDIVKNALESIDKVIKQSKMSELEKEIYDINIKYEEQAKILEGLGLKIDKTNLNYANALELFKKGSEYAKNIQTQWEEVFGSKVGAIKSKYDELLYKSGSLYVEAIKKRLQPYLGEVSTLDIQKWYESYKQGTLDISKLTGGLKDAANEVIWLFGEYNKLEQKAKDLIQKEVIEYFISKFRSAIDAYIPEINQKLQNAFKSYNETLKSFSDNKDVVNSIIEFMYSLINTKDSFTYLKKVVEDFDYTLLNSVDTFKIAYSRLSSIYSNLKSLQSTYENISTSLTATILNIKRTDSVYTPQQKYKETKRQWEDLVGRAKSGDIEAYSLLTSLASEYLESAKNVYKSSKTYQDIRTGVLTTLSNLKESLQTQEDETVKLLNKIYEALTGVLQNKLVDINTNIGQLLSNYVSIAYNTKTSIINMKDVINSLKDDLLKNIDPNNIQLRQKVNEMIDSLQTDVKGSITKLDENIKQTLEKEITNILGVKVKIDDLGNIVRESDGKIVISTDRIQESIEKGTNIKLEELNTTTKSYIDELKTQLSSKLVNIDSSLRDNILNSLNTIDISINDTISSLQQKITQKLVDEINTLSDTKVKIDDLGNIIDTSNNKILVANTDIKEAILTGTNKKLADLYNSLNTSVVNLENINNAFSDVETTFSDNISTLQKDLTDHLKDVLDALGGATNSYLAQLQKNLPNNFDALANAVKFTTQGFSDLDDMVKNLMNTINTISQVNTSGNINTGGSTGNVSGSQQNNIPPGVPDVHEMVTYTGIIADLDKIKSHTVEVPLRFSDFGSRWSFNWSTYSKQLQDYANWFGVSVEQIKEDIKDMYEGLAYQLKYFNYDSLDKYKMFEEATRLGITHGIKWFIDPNSKRLTLKFYEEGGIVTKPTLGLIGEAGYPEAVIPLKYGYVPVKIERDKDTITREQAEKIIYLLGAILEKQKEVKVKAEVKLDGKQIKSHLDRLERLIV